MGRPYSGGNGGLPAGAARCVELGRRKPRVGTSARRARGYEYFIGAAEGCRVASLLAERLLGAEVDTRSPAHAAGGSGGREREGRGVENSGLMPVSALFIALRIPPPGHRKYPPSPLGCTGGGRAGSGGGRAAGTSCGSGAQSVEPTPPADTALRDSGDPAGADPGG